MPIIPCTLSLLSFLRYCMTLHQISFSFSAIARLAVPPGKWFCLSRTGLGYTQYSCCVCGLHHDVFSKYWKESENITKDWETRLVTAIDKTLIELQYGSTSDSKDIPHIRETVMSLIRKKDNYIINEAFSQVLSSSGSGSIAILTDGPQCLVKTLLPDFPSDSIFVDKSALSGSVAARISRIHVGTNLSDLLYVPQTKFIISRKIFPNLPQGILVFPKLTTDVMQTILQTT